MLLYLACPVFSPSPFSSLFDQYPHHSKRLCTPLMSCLNSSFLSLTAFLSCSSSPNDGYVHTKPLISHKCLSEPLPFSPPRAPGGVQKGVLVRVSESMCMRVHAYITQSFMDG